MYVCVEFGSSILTVGEELHMYVQYCTIHIRSVYPPNFLKKKNRATSPSPQSPKQYPFSNYPGEESFRNSLKFTPALSTGTVLLCITVSGGGGGGGGKP